MIDLTTLNDQELNDLCMQVQSEQTKRQETRKLPQQVEELARQYVELTGETQPLIDAVNRGVEPLPAPTEA